MKSKEPDFMQELHTIREKITRDWKKLSFQQISSSLHRAAKEFKAKYAIAHR